MRVGIFAIGAVILILGIMIVANDQPKVSAVESMFGGWAMLSPEYQSIVQELMMGYVLALIGIVIMIPALILKNEPMKPKRDLKKSPTVKGIIIGIIAISIILVATFGLTYQTFTMTSDIDTLGIKKGDLVRFDNTPFHEIQINDMISYYDNDKVWVHKVISVDSSKVPRTLTAQSTLDDNTHLVTEDQYIGKLDSVTKGAGITAIWNFPLNIIILIAVFAIPIAVMKNRK